MKLLVIVLCLLSERFLIHAFSYERFSWFTDYCNLIKINTDKNPAFNNTWLMLAAIVTPIMLIIAIIYILFHGLLYGFVGLIISLLIFFYCLGPQNAFYPASEDNAGSTDNAAGHYFSAVNGQLFAPIFWYILTGPLGVLVYRLISLSTNYNVVSERARQITNILDWLPARVTALFYLLAGNFQAGFALFIRFLIASPELNNTMLSDCGLQAVRSADSDVVVSLSDAETLVEHSAIVMLVLIALFTLVAWL